MSFGIFKGLPSKKDFMEAILSLPMEECIVRKACCAYVYREDHERYCFAGEAPKRIIDMTECPIGLKRRKSSDEYATTAE